MRDQISLRDHTLANKRAVYVSLKKFKSQTTSFKSISFFKRYVTVVQYDMFTHIIVHLTESNRDK
jgi:hypothetical protein